MFLDLHVHSIYSGDSPVEPEQYARRMIELKDDYDLDGFVLMEHNYFIRPHECDLEALSDRFGLVILSGVEVDTHWGHLLVYGITEELWSWIEGNGLRKQEPLSLARAAVEEGAVVVPSHPFRGFIGLGQRSRELEGVSVIETFNASDTDLENASARRLAERMGWAMIGGSDGHFPGELGKGLTRFERPIKTMAELCAELKSGRVRPASLEDARINK